MATLTVSTPYIKGGRSIVRAQASGDVFLVPFTFVPSSSYATNGDTIGTANMPTGYKDLLSPWAFPSLGGYSFFLDTTNAKLKVFAGGSGGALPTEIANASNTQTALGTSAVTIYFLCR